MPLTAVGIPVRILAHEANWLFLYTDVVAVLARLAVQSAALVVPDLELGACAGQYEAFELPVTQNVSCGHVRQDVLEVCPVYLLAVPAGHAVHWFTLARTAV